MFVAIALALSLAEAAPSPARVRVELLAARAAGTVPAARARLLASMKGRESAGLRLFVTGYAALLTYDRAKGAADLARSFSISPSPYAAEALATNAADAGTHGECREWASRGLETAGAAADVPIRVELLAARSLCLFYAGRYAEQRADLDEGLRLARAAAHQASEALVLRTLGTALHNSGESARGLAMLEEAVAIGERVGDELALGLHLFNLSSPYPSAHPFADKIPILDRALALARKVRDRQLEGRVLGQRGATFILLARYGAAMRDLVAADRLMREAGVVRSRATVAGNLSLLFTELGDYARADEQARLSLALYRRAANTSGVRQILAGRGDIALRRGDVAAAFSYQRQVVALNRELNDRLYQRGSLLRLAATQLARRDWRGAEASIRESIALSEESGDAAARAAAQTALGDLLRLTAPGDDAQAAYGRALTLAAGTEAEARVFVRSHHGLGLLDAAAGRRDEAIAHFRRALDRIEDIRDGAGRADLRLTYFSEKQAIYLDAIGALVDAHRDNPAGGHLREALTIAERAKARALLDAIAGIGTPAGEADVQSIALIAATLQPAEVLVEFVLGPARSFRFTLMRDGGLDVTTLPGRAALERLVTDFRAHVGRRPDNASAATLADVKRRSQSLYRVLIGDALEARSVRRLVIVGDGLLFYAPFEALAAPGAEEYLGEQYEIVRAPSGSVLAMLRRRAPLAASAQFIGFGDPWLAGHAGESGPELVRALERDGFSFAPLPGSKREVALSADVFRPGGARVYTGREFTAHAALQELQRPNRIVHFATHAILDERVPDRSGIVVSSVDDDGAPALLRARDLAGLKIPVDLITLSGCQTGLGRVIDGEGVTGLAWALSRAGASSVMVTLWNISDAVSATPMVAFYRALDAGQSKAAALVSARRELSRGPNPMLRHPYYWAGYALIGNPE